MDGTIATSIRRLSLRRVRAPRPQVPASSAAIASRAERTPGTPRTLPPARRHSDG